MIVLVPFGFLAEVVETVQRGSAVESSVFFEKVDLRPIAVVLR